MKKITYKNLLEMLKSKTVLAISGGLILMSCGTQMGGYSETDGVYYDPNKDTLPEGTVMNSGNRVGEYYDYQANDNQNKYLNSDNRNEKWNDNQNSDWGVYTGTDTYYNDSWDYPFGFYSGFGFGMSYGWGSPWGYGGYYSPWGFGYNPWYGYYSPYYGYGNPYYGYNPYFGYNPYYGYHYPYGSGHNTYGGGFINKRSGADGAFRNSSRIQNSNVRTGSTSNSGFRTGSPRINTTNPQMNTNPRFNQPNQNTQPRMRTSPQPNTTPRQNSTPRQSVPNYNQPTRTYDGGGFRSGNSGSYNSGSSNSGSNSGSTRSSGGFRR